MMSHASKKYLGFLFASLFLEFNIFHMFYSDSSIVNLGSVVIKTTNLSKLHFLCIEPCDGSSPDLEGFFSHLFVQSWQLIIYVDQLTPLLLSPQNNFQNLLFLPGMIT